MCGIVGMLTSEGGAPDGEALRNVCRLMAHRGPDAEGFWGHGPVLLGHRRLSIIDLSPEASQPLVNESGDVAIAVNGEIYNFLDLRPELETAGHVFRSRSDSEVALHLYEQMGEQFVARLRGMFALALWDGRQKKLILARDRFGKKPIFYYFGPRGLVFASEVQALAGAGLIPKEPDPIALDAYLALQYVPSPWCAFRGVKKLPPGHILVCRPGEIAEPQPYYRLSFARRDAGSFEDQARRLRHLLQEAVRIRLVSDVPLGAFLSGGIDSTAVVALMSGLSSKPVKTFSIGFGKKDDSETAYARCVAEHYSTDHPEMDVEPDMVDVLPRLVRHYGEPYADTSAVPTWYLSQFTRRCVTVALSGDAGDECFGGYKRYRYEKVGRWLAGLPRPLPGAISKILSHLPVPAWQPLRDFGARLGQGLAKRYLGLVAHFPWEDRREIYSVDFLNQIKTDLVGERFERLLQRSSALDPTNALMELDINTYLPDDILVKVDIASMAHALEVRCPILDQEVMEFAAAIPGEHKTKWFSAKRVFKEAVRDLLPAKIARRGKRGFALPIDRWMREDLAPMAKDILLDGTARQRGLFEPQKVERLLRRHLRGESRGLQLWNLLVLEQWWRTFID